MIFVTVGTHEQPFDRLIKYIDQQKNNGNIKENVVIQTGYCTYEPKYCVWKKLYTYEEMLELVKKARIVITHGGPSSFIMPLQIGKTPIVIPRKYIFNEHINDHQVSFSKTFSKRMNNIIMVESTKNLLNTINNYDNIVRLKNRGIKSNNLDFNKKFEEIVKEVLR